MHKLDKRKGIHRSLVNMLDLLRSLSTHSYSRTLGIDAIFEPAVPGGRLLAAARKAP